MDNISDPPVDGVDTTVIADSTKSNDPPVEAPSTDTPVVPTAVDNVEAIAKRVSEYMVEERAQHLTIDGNKQISEVDAAYGRR